MDFDDTHEEAVFRQDARAWLMAHAKPRSQHDGDFHLIGQRQGGDEGAWVAANRAWQRTKAEGGYAAITWPVEHGGRGGTPMHQIIFDQEEASFDVATGAFSVTLGMVAPTLLAHGTTAQKAHVPSILRGEEIWCQMFSEPAAGSDLAGLRTRAVRDGDEWRITGQKVWTSGAHYAQWGYIICRTDVDVPKHKGLTAFIFPMDSPGVTVRPLRDMGGASHFNEVFLDEVRVSEALRLDEVGSGWRVALTTLMNERFSVGALSPGAGAISRLRRLAVQRGRDTDPRVRDRLARIHTLNEVNRFTSYRSLTTISRGGIPGPEGSIGKLAVVRLLQEVAALGAELAGPDATLEQGWADLLCAIPGIRIAGGTDEVMRNIIGERVLGLPGEPRVDRDVPFVSLPA